MYDLAVGTTTVLCSLRHFMRYTLRRLCGTPTRAHLQEALV
jgi:hypothetical protein